MTINRMRIALPTLSFVLCIGSGCGYSMTRPFPDGIESVHVETFHSKDFRRGLEFELSEALVKRINMDTPYRIAALKTADTVLSGEILEVRNRSVGNDFVTQRPREITATVVAAFRWKDLRSGKIILERERFMYTTSYIPPVGETFSKGMVRGLDGMAEVIVEAMESSW